MSATVQVKIDGLDKFTARMARMSKAVASAKIMDSLEAGGYVIMAHAQDNIRTKLNKHPTGFLANSVKLRREGKSVLVGPFGVVYAKIHEFGGVIKSRPGKGLRFQINGEWIIRQSVTIPARPYMRPAVNENMSAINAAIGDALEGLINGA